MYNLHKWTWIVFPFFLIACDDGSSSLSSMLDSSESILSSSAALSSSGDEKSSNSAALSSSGDEKSSSSAALSSSVDEKSSSSAALSSSVDEKSSSSAALSSSVDEKSSSSVALSSSVDEKSSSSVIPTVMSIYDSENNTLTDLRDNKIYKTVTIGAQIWMAENLNYEYIAGEKSFCYNDSIKYCDSYGRLYLKDSKNIVCPEKWHLPDSVEWQVLFDNTGNKNGTLKAESSWREWDGEDMGGTNEYGFSAYAAGYKSKYSSKYYGVSELTYFYVSNKSRTILISMYNAEAPLYRPDDDYMAVSIRCIKDSE